MAFNKSKALEDAAKLVSQRRFPQAIKQYQSILERDPQDLLLRNVLGDLLVRAGNVPEALREFNALADTYAREGFTLKAIAIYKKITKLDTESVDPLLKLADLYAGQKLNHEASEQYSQALALTEKKAQGDRAAEVLKKLVALDPGDAVHRVRLGELLGRQGRPQEACQWLLDAAGVFLGRRDTASASAAMNRAAQIDPENQELASFRARLNAAATSEASDLAGAEAGQPARASATPSLELRESSQRLDGQWDPSLIASQTPAPQHEQCEVASTEEVAPRAQQAEVPQPPEAVEVDFSSEWEAFAPAAAISRSPVSAAAPEEQPPVLPQPETAPATDPSADESQFEFYLQHGFVAEAGSIVRELARRRPDDPRVAAWQGRLDGILSARAHESEPVSAAPAPSVDSEAPVQPWAIEEELKATGPSAPVRPSLELEPSVHSGPQSGRQTSSFFDDLAADLTSVLAEDSGQAEEISGRSAALQAVSPLDTSLGELLSELDPEPESSDNDDSPDRQYNLGVAFQEMGLIDEAISAFQKVVKGRAASDLTPRFLEATSRLGSCFMEKRMPEIAARWFLRALEAPGLDEEGILALNYDLAVAYEQCGNVKAAQERFSEVYSVNIDYRDVSERLQLLRPRRA